MKAALALFAEFNTVIPAPDSVVISTFEPFSNTESNVIILPTTEYVFLNCVRPFKPTVTCASETGTTPKVYVVVLPFDVKLSTLIYNVPPLVAAFANSYALLACMKAAFA